MPDAIWADCQLLYLCSPNNPTGSVLPIDALVRVLELAERFDFVVAADECYSEIYPPDRPPPCGLLQACTDRGDAGCDRALVFHSLSKRSSLAGLRSGFVAGCAGLIDAMARYRTYHGVTLPVPVQRASIAAWSDEAHVGRTREAYRARFDAALAELDCRRPAGGFYLWLEVGGDDCRFAVELYERHSVEVLPGSLMAMHGPGGNPGAGRVRISLVDEPERCAEGARRIAQALAGWAG